MVLSLAKLSYLAFTGRGTYVRQGKANAGPRIGIPYARFAASEIRIFTYGLLDDAGIVGGTLRGGVLLK